MVVLSEVMVTMMIYAGVLIAGFVMANLFSGGAVTKIMRCKMSGGKRVLLKIHGVTGPYLSTGKLSGKVVTFRVKGSKEDGKLTLPEDMLVMKWLGVNFLEISEDGKVITHDFRVVSGHDAEVVDSLMKRIAMLPKRPGIQELLIMIGIALCVIGIAYVAFKLGNIEKSIEFLVSVAQTEQGVIPVGAAVQ